jgi:hypothetical protein
MPHNGSMLWLQPAKPNCRMVEEGYASRPPVTAHNISYYKPIPFTAVIKDEFPPHYDMSGFRANASEPMSEADQKMQFMTNLANAQGMSGDIRQLSDSYVNLLTGGVYDEEKFHEISNHLKEDLFDIDNKIEDRIFGWMPWGWGDSCKNSSYNFLPCTSFVILIGLYVVGMGSFLLTSQRISICEQELVPLSSPTLACKDLATTCQVSGTFSNFKLYVEFRVVAFIMLLVPFLYIPYMTIMEISFTAKKLWETMGIRHSVDSGGHQTKFEEFENTLHKSRRDTITKGGYQGDAYLAMETTKHTLLNLSSSGHEKMLLTLFLIFHIVWGGFSIALDGSAMFMNMADNAPCGKLQKALNELSSAPKFNIQDAAKYNLVLGCFFFALTFIFMFYQWGVTMHRVAFKRKEKKRNLHAQQMELHRHHNHKRQMSLMKQDQEKLLDAKEKEIDKMRTQQRHMDEMNHIRGQYARRHKYMDEDHSRFQRPSNTSIRSSSSRPRNSSSSSRRLDASGSEDEGSEEGQLSGSSEDDMRSVASTRRSR